MKTQRTFFTLLVAVITLLSGTAWAPATTRTDIATARIRFVRGATSEVVSGDLPALSSTRYVLNAAAGQLLEVTLSGPESVSLKATTLSGRALTPVSNTGESSTGFRGYLPYSGSYYLTVTSGSARAAYSLSVSIPVRVSFDRDATSAARTGRLKAQQSLDYILHVQKGQLLEVVATAKNPGAPLQLVIYGVDGTVLRSGMGEGSSFVGEVPLSQDYLVSIRAGDIATNFTLNVIIPQRIRFRAGASSVRLSGWLPAQHTQYYVLRAMAGQEILVRGASRFGIKVMIYGADGTRIMSGSEVSSNGESANGENANGEAVSAESASISNRLPSTQDYILFVQTGSRPAAYNLRIVIR